MLVQRLEIAQESLSKIGGRLVTGPLLEKLYGILELAHGTVELWAHCQVFPGHNIFTISLTVPQFFSAAKWNLHIFIRGQADKSQVLG